MPVGGGMTEGLLGTLASTAATVGALHSIAPDHWVPFAALGLLVAGLGW